MSILKTLRERTELLNVSELATLLCVVTEATVQRCIQLASQRGDVILDPFSGARTTGCAAKELERHYVGLDISADYLESAKKRIEEHAGQFPTSERGDNYVPDGLSEIKWDEMIQATL